MSNLTLKFSKILQGDFRPQRVNVMLTFQVNCPGCFLHALPTLLRLYVSYSEGVGFLLLSTAFEDFELNTLENTQKLLASGEVIGETCKALAHYGLSKFPNPIPCAVAFDSIEPVANILTDEFLERLCRNHPGFANSAGAGREQIKNHLRDYFLKHYQRIGYTFAANLMQGTPTWIIFDDTFKIHLHGFGHHRYESLQRLLETQLLK
jgi:hypothetical protein